MNSEQRESGRRPGSTWRLLARDGAREFTVENQGTFDELVVDQWLHLEQMDENTWWMRVGDCRIDIKVDINGRAQVAIERDVYE